MRLAIAAALTLLALPAAIFATRSAGEPEAPADHAAAAVEWEATATPAQRARGEVQFALSRRYKGGHWMHSHTRPLAELTGLSPAAFSAGSASDVAFALVRDAGTIACRGTARQSRGSGACDFRPDRAFAAWLGERGFGTPNDNQLFSLALANTGRAFAEEAARQNYTGAKVADLVRAGEHGVTADYIRKMGAHGYRVGTLDALIDMRDHGVGPEYIAELAQNGIRDIPAVEIVRLRDHGVSAEFVAAVRAAGYRDIATGDLIRLRDHGVTAEFIAAARRHNVAGLAPADLVQMRDHGVSPEFLADLAALGYDRLRAGEIVQMRIHGVDAAFIRRANASGGRRTPEELVALRIGGFANR